MEERNEFEDGSIYESKYGGKWEKVTDPQGRWMIDDHTAPGHRLESYSNPYEKAYALSTGETVTLTFGKIDKECQAYRRYQEHKCAIATATIGHHACQQLDVLRRFRDKIVTQVPGGWRLNEHYNHIKSQVALLIQNRRILKGTFLYPFILPSLKLLGLKHKNTRGRDAFLNTLVFIIYLLGLGWATLLFFASKFFKSD